MVLKRAEDVGMLLMYIIFVSKEHLFVGSTPRCENFVPPFPSFASHVFGLNTQTSIFLSRDRLLAI